MDRIDIHVEVPAVPFTELRSERDGTPSSTVREQVLAARERQEARFGSDPGVPGTVNGRMSTKQVRKYCKLDAPAELVLRQAMTELGLSARAHDKILRLSRTIADLADVEDIAAEHVAEAIH